ncbi:cellulose synthase-like A02 [Perilla frutescens var. frutescens]|nr:cellulose synthase-like A02 [Perilla frutescens var. frutescens]
MAEMSLKDFVTGWVMGSTVDTAERIGQLWGTVKATFLARSLRICLFICLIMSTMLFVEWIYIGIVVVYVKLFKRKPEKKYKWEAIVEDSESGNAAFPMVLVQIPIFNEKEVFKLSIGAACNLSWPADRLLIQVMDGSTDILVKEMVEKECARWASQGINIRYQSRNTREGFKAGALKEGLEYEYVKECHHVAIFDSDFQPDPDFLRRAVPFLIHNPDLALVQARWRFVNADECLLTRLQEMSLDYHFIAEQEVGSSVHSFFGFNGSGGIWRIAAMKEAGGWDDRTTAEDMDLAIRASLEGWKLVYVGSLQVKSELPSTFKAFRSQQHRWSCGPNNLFKKVVMDIIRSKKVSLWKKTYMIYNFFIVRKIIGHTCIFFSYCFVLPLTILVPEVDVPKGGAVFVPCIITAINASVATPRSLHLVVVWVLFECVMSFHHTRAIFTGLLGTKSANEWLVTQKLGDSTMRKTSSDPTSPKKSLFEVIRERVLLPELGLGMFLFISGLYGLLYRKDYYFIYLFIQAITFTVVGFGFVGKILPS